MQIFLILNLFMKFYKNLINHSFIFMESLKLSSGKLIDAHCHLQDYSKDELSQVMASCQKENFQFLLSNSTKREDFDTTLEISKIHPQVIPGFGHHPWYLENLVANEKWFEEFTEYIKSLEDKGVKYFIGEIGIDGGKPKKKVPLDKQSQIFTQQLEFANGKNKLVAVHCVYEWDKLFKLFEKSNIDKLIDGSKIILHSFQGNRKIMQKFQKFNVWFSLSAGCYTEKNFEVIESIPLDRLLLESDAPSMFNKNVYESKEEYSFYFKEYSQDSHLDNEKYKNHPLSIIQLAKKICALKKMEYEEFIKVIGENNKKIIEII